MITSMVCMFLSGWALRSTVAAATGLKEGPHAGVAATLGLLSAALFAVAAWMAS